jgi:hypothetical protein
MQLGLEIAAHIVRNLELAHARSKGFLVTGGVHRTAASSHAVLTGDIFDVNFLSWWIQTALTDSRRPFGNRRSGPIDYRQAFTGRKGHDHAY